MTEVSFREIYRMILTVAAYKGGVGKTTSAVHLAGILQQKAPTLLIDADENRSALGWAGRGELPFKVVGEQQGPRFAREHTHIVIDTAARPEAQDMKELVEGCDEIILPCTPDALSLDATMLTVEALKKIKGARYRVLLTICPPLPNRDAEEARKTLEEQKLPIFKHQIRRLVAFQRAALAGQMAYQVNDPRAAQAWADYVAVGREITG